MSTAAGSFVVVTRAGRDGAVAVVTLARGKVNALDPTMVDQLAATIDGLSEEPATHGIVLTGRGAFFSFGFDVPAIFVLPRSECEAFLVRFCELYRRLFALPVPVVAAVNGHAVAGGCMLALAADARIAAARRLAIGLNEIRFASSVFAGSVEMLVHAVGARNAEHVLYSGTMYDVDAACRLGLCDRAESPEGLVATCVAEAEQRSEHPAAFASLKRLVRGPTAVAMAAREPASIREFLDIWYSPTTRDQLRRIAIRE